MLVDSGIFKEKNIIKINKDSISKGERHSMMLVNFYEFANEIVDILKYKKDGDSLIIYAPQAKGRIEQPTMELINNNRNSIVVNFRGRLLNDILVSMITTTYEKG